jgi:hypothetical protein
MSERGGEEQEEEGEEEDIDESNCTKLAFTCGMHFIVSEFASMHPGHLMSTIDRVPVPGL